MSSLISVIVPVYNTGKYLDKCVLSILNQTYKNLEIILVDDGSSDGSSERCDYWKRVDSRVVVIHKPNGGQASARNVALDVCQGDYIGFVDSDDWIDPEMYDTLLKCVKKHDTKLAVCGRCDAFEDSNETCIKRLGESGLLRAYDVLPKMTMGQMSDFSVCDKLHARELWREIRFPEGEIYEDFAVMYKVLIMSETVVLCDNPFYVYFHRSNSTVTSGFREALIAYPKQTKDYVDYISKRYPEYTKYAIWAHIKALQLLMIKLLRSDKETYRTHYDLYMNYVGELKKTRYIWAKDPLFTKTDRIINVVLQYRNIARSLLWLKKSRFR